MSAAPPLAPGLGDGRVQEPHYPPDVGLGCAGVPSLDEGDGLLAGIQQVRGGCNQAGVGLMLLDCLRVALGPWSLADQLVACIDLEGAGGTVPGDVGRPPDLPRPWSMLAHHLLLLSLSSRSPPGPAGPPHRQPSPAEAAANRGRVPVTPAGGR